MPPLDKCGGGGQGKWTGGVQKGLTDLKGRGMNVPKRGQAVTEVGQNQDRISTATEDVFIHLDQFGSSFKHSVGTLAEALLHFLCFSFAPQVSILQTWALGSPFAT